MIDIFVGVFLSLRTLGLFEFVFLHFQLEEMFVDFECILFTNVKTEKWSNFNVDLIGVPVVSEAPNFA